LSLNPRYLHRLTNPPSHPLGRLTQFEEKARLRELFRSRTTALGGALRHEESGRITRRLETLTEIVDAQFVLAFYPAPNEPDFRSLLRLLMLRGKTVLLPVVTDFSRTRRPGQSRIGIAEFRGNSTLTENRWGILEPSGPLLPLTRPEVVLVPALAVDRSGHRLGHGFGYYDELLGALCVPTICPVFSSQLTDHLPCEPHDQRVSCVVTHQEMIPERVRA